MTDSKPDHSETELLLRGVLADVLGLSAERVAEFTADTGLFGHLPELDSMAVAGLLTEMEDRLDIVIDDRQPLAGAPGQTIAYEQIAGRARLKEMIPTFDVDIKLPENAAFFQAHSDQAEKNLKNTA